MLPDVLDVRNRGSDARPSVAQGPVTVVRLRRLESQPRPALCTQVCLPGGLQMARLQLCALALLVLHSCALRAPREVAGDQPPQLYPAVTVHVPEPAGGAPGSQAKGDAFSDGVARLNALEQQLAAHERAVLSSFDQLGRQIESLTDTVSATAQ